MKITDLSPPTSSTVTICEVPLTAHDSKIPVLSPVSVIITVVPPSMIVFALPVEFANLQLALQPISPISASDIAVFPPFVSVSLLENLIW